jgi:hypothetical protein
MSLQEIANILEENYFVLGVTGSDAIVNIYDEMDAGYFDNQIVEWGITMSDLFRAVAIMRQSLTRRGLLRMTNILP